MKGVHHSYALVDEVDPADAGAQPRRGSGRAGPALLRRPRPATVKDFTRWATLTIADTKAALAELGDELEAGRGRRHPALVRPDAGAPTQPGRAGGIPLPHL